MPTDKKIKRPSSPLFFNAAASTSSEQKISKKSKPEKIPKLEKESSSDRKDHQDIQDSFEINSTQRAPFDAQKVIDDMKKRFEKYTDPRESREPLSPEEAGKLLHRFQEAIKKL